MCEHSRLSSVAALREARRRKILENSTSRLKLIEGIKSYEKKEYCAERSLESLPEPETQISENASLNVKKSKSKINSKLNEFLNENKDLKEISDFILRGDETIDEDVEEETKAIVIDGNWGKIFSKTVLEKKLHYILLAVIVNIMLVFNVGHLFYENVLCPFYSVKLVEVLSKREVEQLQPVVLLFIAGLPRKLQKFTKITLFVLSILLSDLCLYLFVFIVGNKLAASLE